MQSETGDPPELQGGDSTVGLGGGGVLLLYSLYTLPFLSQWQGSRWLWSKEEVIDQDLS